MRGKRGWIRILEATIAVLIVSGTMMAIYLQQPADGRESMSEYAYSFQMQVLEDIVSDSSLRFYVLSIDDDLSGSESYEKLDEFVGESVPDVFGYLIRVCDPVEICKMHPDVFIATLDKDVFVEEVVISSELKDGASAIYSPKRVRLFFWENR
jgi:hypothetical protein